MRENHQRLCAILAVFFFLSIWLFPGSVPAALTTAAQARRVVQGWLARDARPLGAVLGREVKEVQSFQAQTGVAYFVVYLEPRGFVIVPGDDLVEPIIAFVPQGRYNPSANNPLGAMVSRDLPQRLARVRAAEARAQAEMAPFQPEGSQAQALKKWQSLQNLGLESSLLEKQSQESGLPTVSDPRVDPLVATRWSQDVVVIESTTKACYNYFTPPNAPGSVSNYPCGCVATALSQLLRYHKYPTAGVGTAKLPIKVDGREKLEALRGGDGAGGAYDWDIMVIDPGDHSTDQQLQAIGALTHDAGTAIKMEYTSASSGANTADVGPALVNVFKYSNAIVVGAEGGLPSATLIKMINPNLDATWPVELGITKTGSDGGHDVVADGYGYNLSTLYHHLNMGWSGAYDAWYNLPNVDLPPPDNYDLVQECVYNVYTSGTGEIISGRVLAAGQPLSGVAVQATSSEKTYTATTNARGIYALAKVPSASTYTIQVTKAGYNFQPQVVTTGTSVSGITTTTGNLWGVNFAAKTKALTGILELLLMN